MTVCIDLSATYGDRYRITHDPAAATWGDRRDPWLMQLPGRAGVIYPHGGDKLALELDNHPNVARQVAAISGVQLWQDGTGERTFLFPIGLFEAVAAIVQPKRRRKMTEEHRAKLIQAGSQALTNYRLQANSGAQESMPEPTISPPGDLEAV